MVRRWFVRCKGCDERMADHDSTFADDANNPAWQNPQWKSVFKCPVCGVSHEYTAADLKSESVPE